MKRTSLWLVLLALLPGSAQAYCYYVPPCYRTHYSMYATNYGNFGLVPGGIDYSPYAVSYRNSGLIPYYVEYTPYALTYRNSGLIVDYYAYPPVYPMMYPYPCTIINNYYGSAPPRSPGRAAPPDRYPSNPQYNRQEPPTTVRPGSSKQEDGLDIIRRYLRDKGCEDASINRILRLGNRLVSVDFTLRDRNLIIKYWNPKEVERLSGAEAKTRVPLAQQRFYEKYKQDWERCAQQHQANGGEIYYVQAGDRETILPALQACPQLEGPPNATLQVAASPPTSPPAAPVQLARN
jgi:hypothetical protein